MSIDFSGVPWFWLMVFVAFVVLPSMRQMSGGRGAKRDLGLANSELDRSRREIAMLRHDLEDRLTEVDLLSARVAELENRLDFTDRLLAQHRPTATDRQGISLQ